MKMNIPIELDVLHMILVSEIINEELVFAVIKKNKMDCSIKTISKWRIADEIPNDKYVQLHNLLLKMASQGLVSLNIFDTTVTWKGKLHSIYVSKGLPFWSFVIGSFLAIAGIIITIICA